MIRINFKPKFLIFQMRLISFFLTFLLPFFCSCSYGIMKKVIKINKTEIKQRCDNDPILKFEYMAHFKMIEFKNAEILALHFSEDWGYLSKDKDKLYKTMRSYMLTQGAMDGFDSPLSKNAKNIIKKREIFIKEFCKFLHIDDNTALTIEQLENIDKLISQKGYKFVYEKYYIHLGLFLGEIIKKKKNGEWFLKEETGIFIKYNVPYIKCNKSEELSPWGLIDKYYDKAANEFSLLLSFKSIYHRLDIYNNDINLN